MCLVSSLKTNLMAVKQESSNQVMQRIYKTEIEPRLNTLPKNSREGFSRVCADPKYTFLESVLYYTILKSQRIITCDVIGVPETQKRESVSMAIKKGSPYTRFFNYKYVCVLRLQTERFGSVRPTCIREVVGNSVVLIQVLCGIPQSLWVNSGGVSELGHYLFIPSRIQFIIYHGQAYSLLTQKWRQYISLKHS
jgi:hypothetical protein